MIRNVTTPTVCYMYNYNSAPKCQSAHTGRNRLILIEKTLWQKIKKTFWPGTIIFMKSTSIIH